MEQPAKLPTQRMILAVARDGLPSAARETSFIPATHEQMLTWLHKSGLWIGPRAVLEEMPQYRQIIPYVALRVGDRYVKYTRTPAGGEARLHGRVSIGLGGHIDLSDVRVEGDCVDLERTLSLSAEREVDEELHGVETVSREWVGLLVDNDTSVGQVHIGVVALWTLKAAPHGAAEDAIGGVGLTTLDDLLADRTRLETWSALLGDWLRRA